MYRTEDTCKEINTPPPLLYGRRGIFINMGIHTTSIETYRLLYTYRLPKLLIGSIPNILGLHIKMKQDHSHLFLSQSNEPDDTILNVMELISTPLNQNIRIVTGIEGVCVRLDLLNSDEINDEFSRFENFQAVV
jgi:hypothetical protein